MMRSDNAFAGDSWPVVEALLPPRGVEAGDRWRSLFKAAVRASRPHAAISEGFHSLWIERGHRIREQIGDDPLVLDALWVLLPLYSGRALGLFRGENLARWRSGEIGFAWTEKEEVARMFGSGLNASPGGGVLL